MKAHQQRLRLVVLCLILLLLPLLSMYHHGKSDRSQSLAESFLLRLTAPGQDAMNQVLVGVVAAWHRYVYLVRVEEQNQALRDQVDELKLVASRSKGLDIETRRLREMLDFKERKESMSLLAARVIGRDSSPQFSVIRLRLDRGEQERVRINHPVITPNGVVGRIEAVSGPYCDVMLITDVRSNMDVEISDRGVSGTLVGTGDGPPIFRFPFHKAQFQKGEPLLTTGHDRVFPKGLVVGYLASDAPRQVGQQQELPVETALTFSGLQDAFIVLGHPDDFADSPEDTP
jgi:rod shape-determining protein MreC